MKDKDDHIRQLESVIKQMLKPIRDVPFALVVEAASNHKIIPFDPTNERDQAVLEALMKTANRVGKNVNKEGIRRKRPNEVGNDIEPFVLEALNEYGYDAHIPITLNGKKKSTGYPDIQFTDTFGRVNYLECKTYNINNIATSQRSFYFSKSDDLKISYDAHHFVISFEVFVSAQYDGMNVYKCRSWKVLSLENLLVDLKYEFNTDNKRLYKKELILAEGSV